MSAYSIDAIDQLNQVHDELATIWLALGNTVDLNNDGFPTPVREALNGTTNRMSSALRLLEGRKAENDAYGG